MSLQKAANAYSDSTKYNTGLVFTIPVYDNMPQETCTAPDGDGDPGNLLSDMYVDGHQLHRHSRSILRITALSLTIMLTE